MKGTRLWQSTGSPLISGRSRRQRPFWQPWLLASLLAGASVAAWIELLAPHSVVTVLAAMFAAAVVGAACGVWLSRLAGWSWPWIVGAVCGIAFAAMVFAIMRLPLFSAMRQVG